MRKTERWIAVAALALLLAAGCKNRNQTSAYTSPPTSNATPAAQVASATPEQLGEIGAQIKRHPREADRILADNGMNEQSFEQAIRQVSSDPDQSRRYAAAYKRAR